MKKSRIILLVTMVMLVVCTCTVWGATQSVRENKRGVIYTKYISGDRTQLCAVGSSSTAYTTMANNSSEPSNLQVNAYVSEYSYATEGWTATTTNGKYAATGESVNSGSITRSMSSYVVEYHHTAVCTVSPYQPQVIDDLEYIADQYYD